MNVYKRLHYSPFDISVILSGIVCMLLGYYFYVAAPWKTGEFRQSEPFGQISSGKGTRKLGTSLQWFDVKKTSELFYGDVIFANEQKDIEITLLDMESKITIPKDSMIKISKSGDEFNLDVSKGSVVIKTRTAKKFRLKNKRGKIKRITVSKNSRIKISAKRSNVVIEAIKGNVSLIGIRGATNLNIGKGKLLLVGPKKSKIFSRVTILKTHKIDPTFSTFIEISNKFKNLSSLELAKNSNFKDSSVLSVNNGKIDIKKYRPGEYFVRESKKFSYDSFEIKALKPLIMNVLEQEQYFYNDKIKIAWNARPDLTYKLEIQNADGKVLQKSITANYLIYSLKREGEIKIKITEPIFKRNTFKIINIRFNKDIQVIGFETLKDKSRFIRKLTLKNPRNILYKLSVRDQNNKVITDKVSRELIHRILAGRPGRYTVQLLSIRNGAKYYETEFVNLNRLFKRKVKNFLISGDKEFKVKLRWRRITSFPREIEYYLKVYKDKLGKELLFEKNLTTQKFNFTHSKVEKLYWQVDSNQSELVSKSPMYELDLRRPKLTKLTSPKIILKYKEKGDCYLLDLPKIENAKIYDLYIYSARTKIKGKRKLMYRKRLNKNNDCLKSKGEGKYYYKYRIEDIWGGKSGFSKLGMIFFPISPLDDF